MASEQRTEALGTAVVAEALVDVTLHEHPVQPLPDQPMQPPLRYIGVQPYSV